MTTFGGLESVDYLSEVRMAAKYVVEVAPSTIFSVSNFHAQCNNEELGKATTVCTGDTSRYLLSKK